MFEKRYTKIVLGRGNQKKAFPLNFISLCGAFNDVKMKNVFSKKYFARIEV